MEKVLESTLRFVYAGCSSTYSELLCKAKSCTLELGQLDSNNLHRDIQNIEPYGTGYINNLIIPNQSNYSTMRPLNLFVL